MIRQGTWRETRSRSYIGCLRPNLISYRNKLSCPCNPGGRSFNNFRLLTGCKPLVSGRPANMRERRLMPELSPTTGSDRPQTDNGNAYTMTKDYRLVVSRFTALEAEVSVAPSLPRVLTPLKSVNKSNEFKWPGNRYPARVSGHLNSSFDFRGKFKGGFFLRVRERSV